MSTSPSSLVLILSGLQISSQSGSQVDEYVSNLGELSWIMNCGGGGCGGGGLGGSVPGGGIAAGYGGGGGMVEGWSERYRKARTPDVPDFEQVMVWLTEKMPPDSLKPGIIHNDYKFDNVVLNKDDPLKIVGVLDWEMATIGDPLMDLGSSLAYWVEKDDPPNVLMIRMMPTHIDGMMSRKEIIERYSERSGIKIRNFDFYHCFGLFRLAVIAQQIYYRFYNGQTKDERFGMLKVAVQVLEETATGMIDKSIL